MIYEQIDNCLRALVNEWEDLHASFERLADELAGQKPVDARAIRGVRGIMTTCIEEVERLNDERRRIPDLLPAVGVFYQAGRVVRESDIVRQQALETFALPPTMAEPERLDFGPEPTPNDSNVVSICRNQLESLRENISHCMQQITEVQTDTGQRFNIAGIREGFDHITSYPVLTSGMGMSASSLPAVRPSTVDGSLQRLVDGALRFVLGRTPRLQDPRSFVSSLNQSFQIVEVEGRLETQWTQRRFAGLTELGGGVSGAQASLYARAKVTRENVLPLLDSLEPLLPDYDDELVDAARAIVRSQLIELVNELGVEGGPRVPRVDGFFASLLDRPVNVPGNQQRQETGYLGYLQFVFGLVQDQINTLEEEAMVTNYDMLRDYVRSLRVSWIEFRNTWEGRDLGTRLVLLERALAVVAETVEEVHAAMDSVYVGEAERQVASFRDQAGQEIRISELLGWVTTFATEEAPHLIDDGGRRGVGAIIPTAITLSDLTELFIREIPYGENLPEGLRHPRVIRPLRELADYLDQTLDLAQGAWRP